MRWHAFPGGSRCAGLPRKMHKTAYFWGAPAARGYLKRVMRDGTFPGGSRCAGLPRKMHKTAYFWGAPGARNYLKRVMRDGIFPGGSCCAGLPRKMHKTAYFWGAPVARDYLKKVMAWQFPHNHDNRKQTSAPMTHVYVMRMYWHATAGCNTLTCSQ